MVSLALHIKKVCTSSILSLELKKALKSIVSNSIIQIGLIIILFFCTLAEGHGQYNSIFFDAATMDNYHITSYTNNNGLKQNIIEQIFFDKNDFLWLSTPSGPVRFDGTKFTYYKSGQENSSRVNIIRQNNYDDEEYLVNYTNGDCSVINNSDLTFSKESDSNGLYKKRFHSINLKIIDNISSELEQKLEPSRRYHNTYPIFYSINNNEQFVRNRDTLFYFNQGALKKRIIHTKQRPYDYATGIDNHFIINKYFFSLCSDNTILAFNANGESKLYNELKQLINEHFSNDKLNRNNFKILTRPSIKRPIIIIKDSFYQVSFSNDSLTFSKLDFNIQNVNVSGIDLSSDKDYIFISSKSQGLFKLKRKKVSNSIDSDLTTNLGYLTHIETNEKAIYTIHSGIIEDGKLTSPPVYIK
ncbi:MAG: hypothetical protein ACI86M_004051 [Saprospiraceae bacterium]|jgi:hypothetical protein